MRKADAYELLSLHGVAEGPSEFIADFDDVMRNNLGRVIASQDVVILGRPTYDEWSEYWPTSTARRSTSSPRRTRRPPGPTPRPSTVTFSTFSRNRRFGGDIGIHESIALTKSLLVNWLVDELQLVAPALQDEAEGSSTKKHRRSSGTDGQRHLAIGISAS